MGFVLLLKSFTNHYWEWIYFFSPRCWEIMEKSFFSFIKILIHTWTLISFANLSQKSRSKFMLLKWEWYYPYLRFNFSLYFHQVILLLLFVLGPSNTKPVMTCWILVMCGLVLYICQDQSTLIRNKFQHFFQTCYVYY